MKTLLRVLCKHSPSHVILYTCFLVVVSLSFWSQSKSQLLLTAGLDCSKYVDFFFFSQPVPSLLAFFSSTFFQLMFLYSPKLPFLDFLNQSSLVSSVCRHLFSTFTRYWSQLLLFFVAQSVSYVLLHSTFLLEVG